MNGARRYRSGVDWTTTQPPEDSSGTVVTRTVQQYSTMSCGGEYIDNLLDGFVGAMVCGFELAIWTVVRIRAVVEAAVGDRSAEPFMEEQK